MLYQIKYTSPVTKEEVSFIGTPSEVRDIYDQYKEYTEFKFYTAGGYMLSEKEMFDLGVLPCYTLIKDF